MMSTRINSVTGALVGSSRRHFAEGFISINPLRKTKRSIWRIVTIPEKDAMASDWKVVGQDLYVSMMKGLEVK